MSHTCKCSCHLSLSLSHTHTHTHIHTRTHGHTFPHIHTPTHTRTCTHTLSEMQCCSALSVLQCVVVFCNVLQCVAPKNRTSNTFWEGRRTRSTPSVLQCVECAVCCNVLQCVAVLQCATVCCYMLLQCVEVCCGVLWSVALRCSVLHQGSGRQKHLRVLQEKACGARQLLGTRK